MHAPFIIGSRRRHLSPKNHFSGFPDMEESNIQAAELPCVGNEFSMLVLLPRQQGVCGQMEMRVSPGSF